MRSFTHPWSLRRIFGRQAVLCVGRSTCPKAGIPARVTPALSSRWICTDTLSRLADLPNLVVDDHWGASLGCQRTPSVPATGQVFSAPLSPTSTVSPQDAPSEHAEHPQVRVTISTPTPEPPLRIIFQ